MDGSKAHVNDILMSTITFKSQAVEQFRTSAFFKQNGLLFEGRLVRVFAHQLKVHGLNPGF